jgi:hypothetical protein
VNNIAADQVILVAALASRQIIMTPSIWPFSAV